jgi:hypothetical protein
VRILLVGTAPPPGGEGALAFAQRAEELAEAGHDVVLLSPDLRSASHRHARLEGALLGLSLIYYSRRFDALELRLESESTLTRAHERLLVLRGLRRWPEVTLRIDAPMSDAVSARTLTELSGAVAAVRVPSTAVADELIGRGAFDATRVVVEGPPLFAPPESLLTALLADGRDPPGRGALFVLAYERVRHRLALAIKR